MRTNLVYLFISILTLTLVLFAEKQIQKILTLAAPQPAQITIHTNTNLGSLNNSWSSFAQGGEESPPMLSAAVEKVKDLSPRYIRIDHIYDSYSVVQKVDSGLTYDFSRLDKTVDDIIASGALPFFSLSYMPSQFTPTGSIIDAPTNWNDWKDLTKATIEHYSGKDNKNLSDVYYEVWNEPELPQFGGWKLSPEKDYRLLYFHAAKGASEVQNANKFYLGGPSVGSYYPDWVTNFLSYIVQNNLRLDFYSWHRYSQKSDIFTSDSQNIRKNLSSFSSFINIPLVLSEWGIDSENTLLSNTNTAASFTVASISHFHSNINLALAFELKDGPPPNGGKWGLITHEKDQNQSLSPKPRYHAFSVLSQMKGNQLSISGEGTYVSGIASSTKDGILVILSNYDPQGKNTENVPITFTDLPTASYSLEYSYPLEQTKGIYEVVSTNGTISKSFLMSANSLLFLKLTPEDKLATFVIGVSGRADDQALVLKNSDMRISFTSPEFRLFPTGNISFDLKHFWEATDSKSFLIFEAPYSTTSGIINKLFLTKQNSQTGNNLVFGLSNDKEEISISASIDNWQKDAWHHLDMNWSQIGLSLSIDGKLAAQKQTSLDIRNGKTLTFYPIEAAIDNLNIIVGNQQVIERLFNERFDR